MRLTEFSSSRTQWHKHNKFPAQNGTRFHRTNQPETCHTRYDAFGNALGFDASTALTTYLYSSMPFDAASGNYYDHARYFDTGTGAFTQSDYGYTGSLADPMTGLPYMYGGGDPINMLDLSGHEFSITDTMAAIGDMANLMAIRIGAYSGAINAATRVAMALTFISFAADPQAAQEFVATGGNPVELVDGLLANAGRTAGEVIVMGRSLLSDARAMGLGTTTEFRSLMGFVNQGSGEIFEQQVLANLRAGPANGVLYSAAASRGLVNVMPDLPVGARFGVADAKNVVSISNTRQIQGFASLAEQNDLPFSLIISPRTEYITEGVTDAIRSSEGSVFQFDPVTETWTSIDIGISGAWRR